MNSKVGLHAGAARILPNASTLVVKHRAALSPAELERADELLWQHLEGREPATQRMTQRRPMGWQRGSPRTWVDGHGDALMTSTAHCASMWFVRSRTGVLDAFHAAYGTRPGTTDLVANFDRMSINLPTSSGNPEALRVAAATTQYGKFGVAQQMHTHSGQFYPKQKGPQYYGIVPLYDMDKATGATALVPGSHLKVDEINASRQKLRDKRGLTEAERTTLACDIEPFTANGLMPVVSAVKAGDCVLFDTRTFHGGCAAEDPSGARGHGPNHLLRAIYILGMTPTHLQVCNPSVCACLPVCLSIRLIVWLSLSAPP